MGPFERVRLLNESPLVSRPLRRLAILAAMAVLVITGTAAAAVEAGSDAVRVTASSAQAVRFRVEDREAVWTPVPGPGEARFSLKIPGFLTTGEPGHPATPRTGGWVVVPPGTRPELVVVAEEWSDADGRLLAVESIPVILEGEEPLDRAAGAVLVLPGEPIPEGLAIPEAARASLATRGTARTGRAATLGEVTWWRGRRIVSYEVNAARHDGQGRASQVLRSGVYEIRFVAERAAPAPPGDHGRKTTGRGDDRFGGIFLNPDLITTQPTEAAWRGLAPDDHAQGDKARPEKAGTLLGAEARLAVWRTGLVRVTYARLRERGFLPEGTIEEDQIRLYQRRYLPRLDDGSGQPPYAEIEVPIHMVGEGDAFDGDDFFVFYGLRLRDDGEFIADLGAGPETIPGCGDQNEWNNAANFYWLAASEPETGESWARMATQSIAPATLTPLTSYRRLDHYEEQKGFRENVPTVTDDRYYYNFYRDSEVSAGMNPLWAPDPAGADVEIEIGYAGFSDYDRTVGLELLVDDNPATSLGTLTVSTLYDSTRTFSVPAADLDGLNGRIRFFNPTTGALLFTYLNWVEISYDARYQAVGGRLEFHGGTDAGPRPMEVTGLDTDDVGLFEITDPRRPVYVPLGAGNLVADGAVWKLSLQPDQAGATRRFAVESDFSADGVPEFPFHLSQVADDPQDPTALAGQAPDLVVITHGDFEGLLDRWLDHRLTRAGGDLSYHVVDVQDLFDWYSGGLRNDRALKRFTTHAMTEWGSWALTVVGDANENALEKGVLASARAWSKDWVPTHYHVQKALPSLNPELMATDKWYATLESGSEGDPDVFPDDVTAPWAMYTGRLPCNSVAELDRMIDKIMVVDNVQADQDWRRRAILIADDQWSNGYGTGALTELVYSQGEIVFSRSLEDSLAPMWRDATGVTLEDDLLKLQTYLDPLYPYDPPPPNPPNRSLYDVREDAEIVATPPLLSALNRGGTLAVFQGHANPYLLASEVWFEDNPVPLTRRDVGLLSNTDKPWLFIGLGCHISDWAQSAYRSETLANEQSLGEKFVVRGGSGASASYGSSGYEYIAENRLFGEYIMRRWTRNPPTMGLGSNDPVRSRWIAGELLWASEADIFAIRKDPLVREMVAQYVLLGDPLMALDAGGPQATAVLKGDPDQEIAGEADLVALDATSTRVVEISAGDEAGIDRIRVTDSSGMDLTGQVAVETIPPGAVTHQRVDYTLTVPIRPYDHSIDVEIWDTAGALDGDRHWTLTLNMPQEALFMTGGEVVDPETFAFPVDTPVEFSTTVTSAAWLDEGMERLLTSTTLAITDTVWTLDKSLGLTVDFTARVPAGNTADEHAVVLSLGGYETEWVLQQGAGPAPEAGIGQVYNFPNPMKQSTRFIFEGGAAAGDGVIRVFSSAGRTVAHIPFHYGGGGEGVVEWDGRDDAGDEIANGTYLYRVELETSQGTVASSMQRLVLMKD